MRTLYILALAGLMGGCAIGGSTTCDGTQKKEGETKRVVIGEGIYVESKGGSCR